jgi:hypothetical protein
MYSIILLGSLILNIVAITQPIMGCNLYNEIQYIKNNVTRTLLSRKFNRSKQKLIIINRMVNRNVMNKYNIALSRYYDVNYNYNCLTDAEKTLLEVIVSLTY